MKDLGKAEANPRDEDKDPLEEKDNQKLLL